jgi:hypothetical protein
MALKSLFEVDLSAHSGKVEQNRRHPLQAGGFLFLPTIFFCKRAPFARYACAVSCWGLGKRLELEGVGVPRNEKVRDKALGVDKISDLFKREEINDGS